jgi:hypothetical protein
LLEANLPVMRTAARGGFGLLGFQYWFGGTRNAGIGGIEEFWFIVIPYWSLLLLTGAAPAWWLYQRRRRKYRREHGLCVACAYDVRESRETCPECGAAVPRRVAATAAEGAPV